MATGCARAHEDYMLEEADRCLHRLLRKAAAEFRAWGKKVREETKSSGQPFPKGMIETYPWIKGLAEEAKRIAQEFLRDRTLPSEQRAVEAGHVYEATVLSLVAMLFDFGTVERVRAILREEGKIPEYIV